MKLFKKMIKKTQSQKVIKSQTPKNNRKNTTKMINTMKVP